MMYASERAALIEAIHELESTGVLEVGGGAIGLRVSEEHALVTPTGIPYRRWQVPVEDLVVANIADGTVAERGARLGAAPTPMFLALLEKFPEIGAIIHGHSEWSLIYAALGREAPAVTNAFDKISPVPLIHCDDAALKADYLREPWPIFYPDAMVRRPDVAAVEQYMVERASDFMEQRREEFSTHSLAFTMYRHGIVVAGHSLDQAAADLAVIESNARTAWRAELASAAPMALPAARSTNSSVPGGVV